VGQAIGSVLALAVGVALSPLPIVAVILMLFSSRARVNGPLFVLGWSGGIIMVSAAAYLLGAAADSAPDEGAGDGGTTWWKIGLGVLLLVLAGRKWHQSRAPGFVEKTPTWMDGIDDLAPLKALVLGLLLYSVSAKNPVLTIAAAASVAGASATTAQAVVALAVFVVVASSSVAVPVIYYFVGGQAAVRNLDDAKQWLAAHNSAMLTVLLLVFGFVLIGKGISA
jgi:hypothetical protein